VGCEGERVRGGEFGYFDIIAGRLLAYFIERGCSSVLASAITKSSERSRSSACRRFIFYFLTFIGQTRGLYKAEFADLASFVLHDKENI
jgi:hypothetical protein